MRSSVVYVLVLSALVVWTFLVVKMILTHGLDDPDRVWSLLVTLAWVTCLTAMAMWLAVVTGMQPMHHGLTMTLAAVLVVVVVRRVADNRLRDALKLLVVVECVHMFELGWVLCAAYHDWTKPETALT